MSCRKRDLPSAIVPRLMFDYAHLARHEIVALCQRLPAKVIRWMAIHHPDNRTRRLFFELTGVPMGQGTYINAHLFLYDDMQGLVSFGKRVAVASGVTIIASSGPNNSRLAKIRYVKKKLAVVAPVKICDDVWIGAQATIFPGVTIGCGAVIGAGAVVVSDVEPYTVVAGVPARVIRRLDGLKRNQHG